jgi:hypothetical protein
MRIDRLVLLTGSLLVTGCWRIGEPTQSEVLITWAAYPDTVVAGEVFSFEFAGPVSPNACGRLDTAMVRVEGSTVRLSGRRSVYDTMCSDSPVSFYEARPLSLDDVGRYRVTATDGMDLGTIVVIDSGSFSHMRAAGEGTVSRAGGCLLFGPGWIGNQRPFAIQGAPEEVAAQSETGRRVRIDGRLSGFKLCGSFGSRPAIVVDTAWVTNRRIEDYYGVD